MWVGPGHGCVVTAGGDDYYLYHAWKNAGDGRALASNGRSVLMDRIDWMSGWPVIHDGSPSFSRQRAPTIQ